MASRTHILRTVLRCGVAFGALPVAQMASAGPADTQVPSATGIEEVVVTAERRSEKLSQVPSAVTSISADQLQAAGALTIRDIAASVPGLQVSQSAGSGEFTIRGITSGNDVNPTVGLLIDGVPIGPVAFGAAGNNLQPELDPSLLSRVEVLRGPQGTLYGSSTLGGIVDYITKAPNLAETEGSIYAEADATEHGDPSEVIRGVFSAPLIQDRVGFQASAFGDNLGGFIDDNARKLNDINYNHSYGGRLAVSAQIDPDLQVEVSDLYSNTRSVEGFVIYNPATRKPAAGDLTYNNVVLPTYDNAFNMLSLNANYDLHWATLSYLGSYQYLSAGSDYDYSAASLGAIVTSYLPAFGGLTLPSPPNPGVFEGLNSHKLTQEVRLASPDNGQLKWIVGLFYDQEHSGNTQIVGSFDSHGSPNPGPLGNLIQYDLLTHYKEYAAYADLTYSITPDLDVTGGLRVEAIDQDYEQLYFGPDAAALNNLYVALGYLPTPADTGVSHAKDTVQTYLANVRYHIAADDMIYFRFATGFRPGGPNIDVPGLPSSFKPDTTSDYEIGWKTNFWNDRGYLDLDVYQIDWNDIQVITFSHGVNGETNGGSATSRGVEAGIDLEPVDGLSLAGTIAYSDAHLNQTIPGGIGDAGDTTPMNPKWSGSVSGEYTWPIASGWSALVNVSAHYVDRRWYGFQHNVIYGNYVLPSSTVVDLRTGVQHDNWELDFFVRNVGDTRAQLAASTLAGTDVTVERPRTLGLSLNMQF